jgi:hypothetical protein
MNKPSENRRTHLEKGKIQNEAQKRKNQNSITSDIQEITNRREEKEEEEEEEEERGTKKEESKLHNI